MTDEIRVFKLLCPKGHDVQLIPETRMAHCADCNCDFRLEELEAIPLDRRGLSIQRPTVYGKPN